jgi:hypothetical protein
MTPYNQYKKGLDLLHLGHYQAGFRLYEFRWHPRTREATGEQWEKWIKAPKWNGESLYDKHITVQMEQGFGDIIQFARFLPMLKAWGARKLSVMAHKSLLKLLGQMECIDDLTCMRDEGDALNADYWVGSMSLPFFALHAPLYVRQSYPITQNYIVGSGGYLNAEPSLSEKGIGVNWLASTGPLHYIKSTPIKELRDMLGDTAFSFSTTSDDIFRPLPQNGWKEDFYKTACHMRSMKAIIAPDTATAHLAGALGVKCFVMLPEDAYVCWRWKNASWYDSVVPLRQHEWHKLPSLLENL